MKIILFFASILMMVSCSKSATEQVPPPKTTARLLTQKIWMLGQFGLDHNNNGTIDTDEDLSQDCHRDNLYRFNPDGTGLFQENEKSCNDGVSEQPFTWKLQKNNSEIEFLSGTLQVLRITETDMVLFSEIPLADGSKLRILISYHH